MSKPAETTRRDRALAWLLRGLGCVDLLAIAVAFLPVHTIAAVNQWMGLESLPDSPLVDYLIRSTSVLYALHGGLMLGLSSDVVRYRPLIRLLGWLAIAHGLAMFFVDRQLGLPPWWPWIEGPTFAGCGTAVLLLASTTAHPSPNADC